jgi:alpha-amylase
VTIGVIPAGSPYFYSNNQQFGFGGFRPSPVRHDRQQEPAEHPVCRIYQEIAKIAAVMRVHEPLRFGRMYYRQISGNGQDFGFPFGSTYTLAFSRILYPHEVLVAYNVSNQTRQDSVVVDAIVHPDSSMMSFLYGQQGSVPVQTAADGTRFIPLDLTPHQFVILH